MNYEYANGGNKDLNKKIAIYEPWFFIFFGVFHLHRLWGLIDRNSYATFWMNVLAQKGLFYYVLMGILSLLCIMGIVTFIKNLHHNYWWRWIYLFGGSYLLFDLYAIATNLRFWNDLLKRMFGISLLLECSLVCFYFAWCFCIFYGYYAIKEKDYM